MDLHGWFAVLRLPIEIVAVGLAIVPALLLLRAWSSLPREVPIHFQANGRPDNWGGRWQAWIVPLVALVFYGALSQPGGAWDWLMGRPGEVDDEIEVIRLVRLPFGLLMTYITWATIQMARKETEGLDLRILYSLFLLMLSPVAGLRMIHR